MLTKKLLGTAWRRVDRARKLGDFFSCMLHWKEQRQDRAIRRLFKSLLKRSVYRIVHHHIYDNMKAPLGNKAKPALFGPSSFDIYFGDNVRKKEEYTETTTERTAYATGSGASSIGLDPRYARVQHLFPELSKVRDIVQKTVQHHYRSQSKTFDREFNHVSVKLYFNRKVTRYHTDIEFTRGHLKPKDNNSQVPGTPVAIATVGDTKYLDFQRFVIDADGKSTEDNKTLRFYQFSGSLLLLDSRDEFLNNEGKFWKHRSGLLNGDNDVSIALMFRVVKATTEVECETGMLRDKKIGGTGKKEAQFDAGWKHYLEINKEDYEKECAAIREKINNKFRKYCM
jgi:hypothetical protein